MRVLINGLPLFSQRLAKDLQEIDGSNSYIFLDTYNSTLDRLKFLFLTPISDLVISMNGVTDESGSLNWVLRCKKKLVMQWMGTDAKIALERMQSNSLNRKYLEYATHYADAPWLIQEVQQLGVPISLLHFKHLNAVQVAPSYEQIRVMSYVPQKRQDFYGLPKILQAAKELPDINFDIYGMSEFDGQLPSNVVLKGWTDEESFAKGLSDSAIFLRLTEHDGFSISVLEALSHGCEVIWTYPLEDVHLLQQGQELKEVLVDCLDIVFKRANKPNREVALRIQTAFEKKKIIANYIEHLKGL